MLHISCQYLVISLDWYRGNEIYILKVEYDTQINQHKKHLFIIFFWRNMMSLNLQKSTVIAKPILGIVVCLGSLSWASLTRADGWPTNVVGNWNFTGNTTSGTLAITTQGTTGNCRSITGTMFGADSIKGFYCIYSGRISFARIRNGAAIQHYQGNTSQQVTTTLNMRMGGVFSSIDANTGGSLGEYEFYGTK